MTTNLPSQHVLTDEEVTALLRGAGVIEEPTSFGYLRAKVSGTTFTIGDDIFVYNPKTKQPAFIAQVVEPPKEYQARYFDPEKPGDMQLLEMMDRQHLAGEFCKSYFDEPTQAREKNQFGDSCRSCLINPFVPRNKVPEAANGKKCQWRGELLIRVLDSDRKATGEEVVLLDLSSTAMQEWKGFASDPEKGYTGEPTFMHKLARLALEKWPDEPKTAIFKALTALRLGGVLAEVRALPQSVNGNNFSVVSLTPIEILDELTEERTALPAADASANADVATDDDVPF